MALNRKFEQARHRRQLRRDAGIACAFLVQDYNYTARGNGSGLCRDATMLRDILERLIESMRNDAGVDPLALGIQK